MHGKPIFVQLSRLQLTGKYPESWLEFERSVVLILLEAC